MAKKFYEINPWFVFGMIVPLAKFLMGKKVESEENKKCFKKLFDKRKERKFGKKCFG
jgi:hypothetical protein